jgi:hypothetical protein
MDAKVVSDEQGGTVGLRDLVAETRRILLDYAGDVVERGCIEQVSEVVARPPYRRQLDVGQSHPLEEVVRVLTDDLIAEIRDGRRV